MSEKNLVTLEPIKELKHASIALIKGEIPTLLVKAETRYIPIDHFKVIFNEIGKLVEQLSIKKLIFDKRNLTSFTNLPCSGIS